MVGEIEIFKNLPVPASLMDANGKRIIVENLTN